MPDRVSPAIESLQTSGQYRDISPDIIPNYLSGKASEEQTIAAIKGTPVFNPTKGPQMDRGNGPEAWNPAAFGPNTASEGVMGAKSPQQIQAEAAAINNAGSQPPVRASSAIQAPTTPTYTPPTDTRQSYDALAGSQGVNDIQSQLDKNAADTRALQDQVASDKYKVKGQPVSSVYIGRALKQIDAETADALNRLKTERANLTDQYRTRTQAVRTIMQTQSQDYRTAAQNYNTQFRAAMQVFTAQSAAEGKELSREQTAANANAKVILGTIKDHPDMYHNPSSEDLANWHNLELQAGLPQGFIQAAAKASPNVKISHWTTNAAGTTFAYGVNGQGEPVILKSFPGTGKPVTPKKVTPTPTTTEKDATTEMTGLLGTRSGSDGYVSPQDYQTARKAWVNKGYSPTTFDTKMKGFKNPSDNY